MSVTPFLGSIYGPFFGTGNGRGIAKNMNFSVLSWVLGEAFAVWNWYNFLVSKKPPTKTVLRVNIDETSVCLWQGSGKGTIAFPRRRRHDAEAKEVVPRKLKRTNLTHVAFICDRPDLQPRMPQIVIGNAHVFRVGECRTLNAEAPGNVLFVRQRSSWNNSILFRRTLRLFVDFLGADIMAAFYVVVLFDACNQHISEDTFIYIKTLGLHPILIPARLTWLLQPLDTHAFQIYKNLLRSLYADARCVAESGNLSIVEFGRLLERVIRQCLQGREWRLAFDADGFGNQQQAISKFILNQLQLTVPPKLPLHKPKALELQVVWPKRVPVPYRHVVPHKGRPLLALLAPPPPAPGLALAKAAPEVAMPMPALPPPPPKLIPFLGLPAAPLALPLAAVPPSGAASSLRPPPPKPPPRRRILPWRPVIPDNLASQS